MKRIFIMLTCAAGLLTTATAQTGNIGIGTTTPGSKLTVNGSVGLAYMPVTSTAYTAGENDFYVTWQGTAAGTITLPVSTSGTDRKGRLYFLKNASATYTLTIDGAGTELIGAAQTLVLNPGASVLLIKTDINTATGKTYEVAQLNRTEGAYVYMVSSATVVTRNQNASDLFNFTSVDASPNNGADFNLTTDAWTCPQSGQYRFDVAETGSISVSAATHILLFLSKNNTAQSAQFYYELVNSTANAAKWGTGHLNLVLNLVQGDVITASAIMCNGCGATQMSSNYRQMTITRL